MYKYVLAMMLGMCVAAPSFAQFSTGKVKRIYPVNDTVYFRLQGDSCITGGQYYYFKMNETDASGKYAAKNWYSMLLASAMAGKPVSVKVNSCPTDGHAKISYIYQDY